MRAVVQRCNWCKITLENGEVSETGKGLVVLLGVGKEDNDNDVNYIADKVMNMRVFEDENQKMNLSLKDVNGELAIVSQFTLYGDMRKGRRPSFFEAEAPERANELYNQLVERCQRFRSACQDRRVSDLYGKSIWRMTDLLRFSWTAKGISNIPLKGEYQ